MLDISLRRAELASRPDQGPGTFANASPVSAVTDDRDEQRQEKDPAGPSQRRPDVGNTVQPRRVYCAPCRWPARLRAQGRRPRRVGGRRRGWRPRGHRGGLRWQEDWHQATEVPYGVAQDRAEIVAFVVFSQALQGEAVDLFLGPLTRDPLAVQPLRHPDPALGEVHLEAGAGGGSRRQIEPRAARRRAGQQHLTFQRH